MEGYAKEEKLHKKSSLLSVLTQSLAYTVFLKLLHVSFLQSLLVYECDLLRYILAALADSRQYSGGGFKKHFLNSDVFLVHTKTGFHGFVVVLQHVERMSIRLQ